MSREPQSLSRSICQLIFVIYAPVTGNLILRKSGKSPPYINYGFYVFSVDVCEFCLYYACTQNNLLGTRENKKPVTGLNAIKPHEK